MGRSCHTEGTYNGSLWETVGGKTSPQSGENTEKTSEPQLRQRAFTHRGSSCGHGAASLWRTSWNSENTETSALQ